MIYPFLSLDDGTEIVHSEINSNGSVKVYIEKPDEADCFHHTTFYLPEYQIEGIYGFSKNEMDVYLSIIKSMEHWIMKFSKAGKVNEETINTRIQIACDLYKSKKVSLRYCSNIAGMSIEEFICYLGKNNVSIFNYESEEEFQNEQTNA